MTPRGLFHGLRGLLGTGLRTRDQLREYRSERLRALVAHAYACVPYYRRLLDRAGVSPADVRDIGDLERIPITERADLQLLPADEVCARGAAHRVNRVVRTSGSSGAPLLVRRTMAEERLALAFRMKALSAWGIGLFARRAKIDHLSPEVVATEARQFYEKLGILSRLNLDWRTPKDEILARLAAFRPDLISGPPSLLAEFADALDEADRARITATRVVTGSELMTRATRSRIASGFGLPVTDSFGCHEVVFIAMETPGEPGYRVCEESVIVEVLDRGAPARKGELVVTGLHLWAMPFIRYRLGDHVELRDDADGPMFLRSIDGRLTDRFRLPDGRRLHGYTLGEIIETSGLPVRRFQITQERRDSFHIRLVLEDAGTPDLGTLTQRAREALGPRVQVRVERVDSIERTSRKFYPFVSLETLQRTRREGEPRGPSEDEGVGS